MRNDKLNASCYQVNTSDYYQQNQRKTITRDYTRGVWLFIRQMDKKYNIRDKRLIKHGPLVETLESLDINTQL